MVLRIINSVPMGLGGLCVFLLLFLAFASDDSLPKVFRGEGHGDAIVAVILLILLTSFIHRVINKRRNANLE